MVFSATVVFLSLVNVPWYVHNSLLDAHKGYFPYLVGNLSCMIASSFEIYQSVGLVRRQKQTTRDLDS